MNRRKLMSFLLSASIAVSSCVSMCGFSVLAAEDAAEGITQTAAAPETEEEEQAADAGTTETAEAATEETPQTDEGNAAEPAEEEQNTEDSDVLADPEQQPEAESEAEPGDDAAAEILSEDEIAESGISAEQESTEKEALMSISGSDAQNAEVITPGQEKTVVIDQEGESVYFRFTPEENGVYTFYSMGNLSTKGILYNSGLEELVSGEAYGPWVNFSISSTLTAGETYFLECSLLWGTGEFGVSLTKRDETLIDSGSCGDNASWELYDLDGIYSMKLSGSGPIEVDAYNEPWEDYKDGINIITIEDGITEIGDFAFYYCSSLTEVSVPDSVQRIGSYAFQRCEKLQIINIPQSVTSISAGAFEECYKLSRVSIPQSVTSIEGSAFENCTGLSEINIPYGIETIEEATFKNCALTEIVIPDSVTKISREAFYGCNLNSIVVPDNLEVIEYDAFSYNNISSIDLPVSLRRITGDIFGNPEIVINYAGTEEAWNEIIRGSGLQYKEVNFGNQEVPWMDATSGQCGDNAEWELTGEDDSLTLTISGSGDMQDFTSYDAPWTRKADKITSILIEDGITRIGRRAFTECVNVKSIDIPGSVKTIGGSAFSYTGLTSVNIPDGVEHIEYSAFYGCPDLTSVTIADSVQTIGSYAFRDCSELTTVRLPGSINPGDYAYTFSGCSKLSEVIIEGEMSAALRENLQYMFRDTPWWKSLGDFVIIDHVLISYEGTDTAVVVPDGVTEIEIDAFYYKSKIESVTLPDSVSKIGRRAFAGCSSLKMIEIPEAVTVIDDAVFSGCRNLTDIKLPSGLTEIHYAAFSSCAKLEKITIPDSVASIEGSAFSSCTALKEIIIPEGVTELVEYTFSNCTSLRNVDIPDTVTRIGDGAFMRCEKLSYIDLPDSVGAIGESAFEDCTNLTFIEIPDGVPALDYGVFIGCSNLTALVIPASVTEIDSYAFYEWGDSHRNIVIYGVEGSYAEEYCELRDDMEFRSLQDISGVKILTQPEDVQASAGERVTFHVETQGSNLSYQWQWTADGTTWKNCTSGGYSTDTFSFNMKTTVAGRQYRCVITFDSAKLITNPAHLDLKPEGELVAQPQDVEAATGETVEFHIEYQGGSPSYQWQWSSNGTTWKNCSSGGYNTDTFSFTMKATVSGRQYRCVITDGAKKVTSDAATVTLSDKELTIVTQPEDVEAAAGEQVVFHIEADGNNPVYQWQWSSNGTTWKNCSSGGYNTDTFSFTMKSTLSGRRYRCKVTDGAQTLTSRAALVTLSDNSLKIITDPSDVRAAVGETVEFHVEANKTDATYQWQWSSNGTTWKNCTSGGYNTDTFSFTMKATVSGRMYRCKVTSGSETVTSKAGTITLRN